MESRSLVFKARETLVVGWLKAAAIITRVDPVGYGLIEVDAKTIKLPHHMECYVVHLADHDWVISSSARQ